MNNSPYIQNEYPPQAPPPVKHVCPDGTIIYLPPIPPDPESTGEEKSAPSTEPLAQENTESSSEAQQQLDAATQQAEAAWQQPEMKPSDTQGQSTTAPAPSIDEALLTPFPAFMLAENIDCESETLPTLQEIRQFAKEIGYDTSLDTYKTLSYQTNVAESFCKWVQDNEIPDATDAVIQASGNTHFWFIGDLHGSIHTMLKILTWITKYRYTAKCAPDSNCGKHYIILLGDILDRGKDSLPLLTFIMNFMMNYHNNQEFQLICIRGNHDAGLKITPEGMITSTVLPSECAEELNKLSQTNEVEAKTLATAAMEFARISPCMVEITNIGGTYENNSILLTHGGVMHSDLQKKLTEQLQQGEIYSVDTESGEDTLNKSLFSYLPKQLHKQCSKDFTWNRISEKLPRKLPNRASSGCEMGTEDINDFRTLHHKLTGRAISFIIRGHDHERPGYKLCSYDEVYCPDSKKRRLNTCGLLTINSMEPDETPGSMYGERLPSLVHWSKYKSLVLYRIPAGEISEPEEQECTELCATAPAEQPSGPDMTANGPGYDEIEGEAANETAEEPVFASTVHAEETAPEQVSEEQAAPVAEQATTPAEKEQALYNDCFS